MQCIKCGSYAINVDKNGRDKTDKNLCDVCYWKKRAGCLAQTDAEKIKALDRLLCELEVDNFSAVMDRPNRRNYHGLLRDGEEIGKVLVIPYGSKKLKVDKND